MFGLDDLVGGAVDYFTGKSNAKAAREAFKNRYQDTVRDMKKAGLNPALAYGQGGGNPQTHDLPELGSNVARISQATSSAKASRAEADLKTAQAALLKAQSADLITNIGLKNELLRKQGGLVQAQTVSEAEKPALLRAQTAESTKRAQNLGQVYLALLRENNFVTATWDQRVQMFKNRAELSGVTLDTAKAERELRQLSIHAARAEANFYKGIGKYSPYVQAAGQIIRGLIPGISIGGDKSFTTNNYIPRK